MLRRILAALLCLIGLVLIGLGIASATVWKPAPTVTATAELTGDAPLVVTAPGVLEVGGLPATLTVASDPETPVFLAYGRSNEVMAWVGSAAYTSVDGLKTWNTLETSDHPGEPSAPNPDGSDLWVVQKTGTGSVSIEIDNGGSYSILAATDGTKPAPHSISLTMPNDTSTPFFIPGVVAGAILLLAGAAILVLSLRRKGSPGIETAAETDVESEASGKDAVDGAPNSDTPSSDTPRSDALGSGSAGFTAALASPAKPGGLPNILGEASPTSSASTPAPLPLPGGLDAGLSRRERRILGQTGELPVVRSALAKPSDEPAKPSAWVSPSEAMSPKAQPAETSSSTLPDIKTAPAADAPASETASAAADPAAKKPSWSARRSERRAAKQAAAAEAASAVASDLDSGSASTADADKTTTSPDPVSASPTPPFEPSTATGAIEMGVPRSARRSEAWRKTWGMEDTSSAAPEEASKPSAEPKLEPKSEPSPKEERP